MRIVIVDYGLGNLKSVSKALEYAGAEPLISRDPSEIERARGVILPGVGAFSEGMEKSREIISSLLDFVSSGRPLLGICLGMQMLAEWSEEGGHYRGLALIPGGVTRFRGVKTPHMGWNLTRMKENPLFRGLKKEDYFYFVHSYYLKTSPEFSIASCTYGVEFDAAVQKENVMGTQFHPEKSGKSGLRVIKNFVEMCRDGS
ncbi:MAG: imidazole glycerol phosphate synthase subunit HisH [Archaeoglobi archaeon]|nr:imidazole glycerol phosphate synthase subunit HisH [Candidatus Mnemosynella sp.]